VALANRVERNKLSDKEIDIRRYYDESGKSTDSKTVCGIDNDYRTCRCRLSLIAFGTDEAIFSMPKKLITLNGIQQRWLLDKRGLCYAGE